MKKIHFKTTSIILLLMSICFNFAFAQDEDFNILNKWIKWDNYGSMLLNHLNEQAFDYLDAPIEIVAGKNTPIPFNVQLEKASVPQQADVIEAVQKVLHL